MPVPVAFGYHPYLVLPACRGRSGRSSCPSSTGSLLDENMIPTGEEEPPSFRRGALEDRSLDDAYTMPERPRPFTVSGGGRTLGVEFLEGYTHAQVFAPAGKDLICFEPMTAPAQRAALARRPAARAAGRAVHGRVPHHRRWLTATPRSAPRPRPRRR